MHPLLVILLVAVALGVVALIVRASRAEKKRTEAMAYASQTIGLVFEPEGDLELLRATADFPLFHHGTGRKVRNLARGRVQDAEISLFDYQYTVSSGEHAQTIRQTVALFPARGLPDFVLAPENVFHRIGQLFGYQDIDFEQSPEFSSHYLLRGADETAIRAAFGADRLAFLGGEPGWTVESRSGHLAVYRLGKRRKPEELHDFLMHAERVWQAFGGA